MTDQTQQQTGPLTLDDVRMALGEDSPMQTNASKIRGVIGRGSLGTIQKHLEFLRTEHINASKPQAVNDTPPPPPDFVASIWSSAWAAAQLQVMTRLNAITSERDELASKALSQSSDISALTSRMDEIESENVANTKALEAARADLESERQKLQAENESIRERLQAENEAVRDELNSLKAQMEQFGMKAAHAAELAAREMEIERKTMQAVQDRLQDQLVEAKSLLHSMSGAKPSAPVAEK